MESQQFDLQSYMTRGVENIVKGALKATLSNPKESVFMAKYALFSKDATKRREKYKAKGNNIPPFLIASITSNCNLHCAGCYSRANHACQDKEPVNQLSAEDWKKVFTEAKELGIGFILLAGGEPLIRKDVIDVAGRFPEILFPVFTNGTMIGDEYIRSFDRYRNIIPVISIEGEKETTDQRRGAGVYETINSAMERMQKSKIVFGASVTVNTDNMYEVLSDGFIKMLRGNGAKVVFYVEYVPVTRESKAIALGDKERSVMDEKLAQIREKYDDMLFVSFPGDEKNSGGCLAAGRGFFHINSHGGAEPCPFSAYSDINIKETSILEALDSKLFVRLRDSGALTENHEGGCVLFEKKELVESLVNE